MGKVQVSDPGLQDEIRKIATEANIVLAKGAVERADENGGGAAPLVRDLVDRMAARSGEGDMGVSTLAEAADILSMNGQVSMVKPGVLCTKSNGQTGPCTRKAGIPDVGNCSPGCLHRLELAAAIQDCASAIERILLEMPSPESPLLRGWWQSQLVGQLSRFPNVGRRYMIDNRIAAALNGVDAASLAKLTSLVAECCQEKVS